LVTLFVFFFFFCIKQLTVDYCVSLVVLKVKRKSPAYTTHQSSLFYTKSLCARQQNFAGHCRTLYQPIQLVQPEAPSYSPAEQATMVTPETLVSCAIFSWTTTLMCANSLISCQGEPSNHVPDLQNNGIMTFRPVWSWTIPLTP
jgi:hypothetical protein